MQSNGVNWSEWIPKMLEAGVILATGVGLWFQNRATGKKVDETKEKLDDNTTKTEQAKEAVEKIQVATVNVLDYERLRRMEAALITLEECEPCREKIMSLTERRRVYPPIATKEPRNG